MLLAELTETIKLFILLQHRRLRMKMRHLQAFHQRSLRAFFACLTTDADAALYKAGANEGRGKPAGRWLQDRLDTER